MLQILDNSTPLDASTLRPLRWGSQGEAEAYLRGCLARLALLDVDAYERFALDASGNTAMRNACAKVAGLTKDRVSTFTQVAIVKDGKTTWTRLRKGESAGRRETRNATLKTYSPDARKAGVAAIREQYGIDYVEDTATSAPQTGTAVYVLRKVANVNS
jgi:hypothetical protein